MPSYLDQFSPDMDIGCDTRVRKAVIIASSQRSGSSLLGYTLGSTGAFGVPLEYFNQRNLKHWSARFGTKGVLDLLDKVEPLRTSPNGVFTIKSHYFQLFEIGSIVDLATRYPDCRFVRILRRNLLGQAISRTVAQQTGVWFSGQTPTGEARYDAGMISENMATLLRQRSQWDLAFAVTGIRPLDIFFEDLRADRVGTLRRIAAFCEIDESEMLLPEADPIRGQNNGYSQDWSARFLAEWSESHEAFLLGHTRLRHAATDIARALRRHLHLRQSRKEIWYPSPNLAEDVLARGLQPQ